MRVRAEQFGGFQLLILILSIYVLIELAVEATVALTLEQMQVLQIIDTLICIFFLIDFGLNLKKAHRAKEYFFRQWGWVDLVSSIPMVGPLRVGRALRLIRLIRLLRAGRSAKHILFSAFSSRANSTLFLVTATCAVLVMFSSVAILDLEHADGSNIKNFREALWWSFVTISTVGYGDKYPVTLAGQVLAIALIIAGVGLFGTFTAYVSSLFIKDKDRKTKKGRSLPLGSKKRSRHKIRPSHRI